MVALRIRSDLASEDLRRLTCGESDGRVCRRLLAIAMALDGVSREEAARQAGMDRQTLRDWIVRYNAEGVDGLRDRARSGRLPLLAGALEAELEFRAFNKKRTKLQPFDKRAETRFKPIPVLRDPL